MKKSELLRALQTEIQNHNLSTFMHEQHRVVITGCSFCRKHFGTVEQFKFHITDDVLPPLLAASNNDEKQTDYEQATPDNPRNDGLMLKCSRRCRVRSVRWFCGPDDHLQANQQKSRALCLTVRKNYFRGGTSLFSGNFTL